ncbi:helix-turn-helix transcriptional regulator, partial [Salmonella enterica subsp. enterica serovar Corvallis]|nr:helix-turn-helix transcriptional regulator [Salmonella enterica subsp. enterica serovar Corvallis]
MKGVSLDELRKQMLNTPEAVRGYQDADRELALIEMLYEMRENAGLTKTEVAQRLDIRPSAISRL